MTEKVSEVKKVSKESKVPNLKYQRDKDREPVRGIFRFYEVPGGSMDFVFRKYKEDPIEKYSFVDGQMYTIPLGVAKHVENDMWYPVHHYTQDDGGRPSQRIGQKVKRAGFQSLEFIDIDDLSSAAHSIITVENV